LTYDASVCKECMWFTYVKNAIHMELITASTYIYIEQKEICPSNKTVIKLQFFLLLNRFIGKICLSLTLLCIKMLPCYIWFLSSVLLFLVLNVPL
jgi:hypothetical protein